jgi:hypothetical protein
VFLCTTRLSYKLLVPAFMRRVLVLCVTLIGALGFSSLLVPCAPVWLRAALGSVVRVVSLDRCIHQLCLAFLL